MSDNENFYDEKQLPPPRPLRETFLTKPVTVSPALADFLGLQVGEKISRSKVHLAITMYIKDVLRDPSEKMNPVSQRNWQSTIRGVIIPDEKFSALLNYPAYVESVAKGEKEWRRRNRDTGQIEYVSETDPKLTYLVVQHLIAKHFDKDEKNEENFMGWHQVFKRKTGIYNF